MMPGMDWFMEQFGAGLIGALLGAAVEGVGRPIGRVRDAVAQWRLRRREEKFLAELELDGEFLVAGPRERVFVYQFSPAGLRITTNQVMSGPPGAEVARLEPDLRPVPPELLQSMIDAERKAIEVDPRAWNEETYGITRVSVMNDVNDPDPRPHLTLDLHRSDYATFNVIGKAWKTAPGRAVLERFTLEMLGEVLPGLSHSLGMNATVVTADGRVLLTQRSGVTNSGRSATHISVNEGVTVHDLTSGRVDPVKALKRGIWEELGIPESDIPDECVTLHSLILDAERYQWGILAHVDLRHTPASPWTASRVFQARTTGQAVDKWESGRLRAPDFTADVVLDELSDPTGWIAHGWVNLLMSGMLAFTSRRDDFLKLSARRRTK